MPEHDQINTQADRQDREPEETKPSPFMRLIELAERPSNQARHGQDDDECAQQSRQHPAEHEHQMLRTQWIIAVTGIALACISLISNVFMYRVSNTSAEAARQSVEAQSQPKLIAQGLRFGDRARDVTFQMEKNQAGPLYEETQREIRLSVNNVGRGTAFGVDIEGYWQTFEEAGRRITLNPFENPSNQLDLGSLDKSMLQVGESAEGHGFIPMRVWDNVMDVGAGGFQVFGWVGHCDLLEIRRDDPFCFEMYKSLDPCVPAVRPCFQLHRVMLEQGRQFRNACR